MRQVAIVGQSLSTHDLAPFEDPEWESWGLPWDRGFWVHYDRMFEMHDRGLLEKPEAQRDGDYFEKLQDAWVPIYMQKAWPDIPTSVEFPVEALLQTVFHNFPRGDWTQHQKDWYNASPAYAIALAIHEDVDRIGLWGIDCPKTNEADYAYQLPNLNWLLGFAAGRGIDIYIPEGPTELLKHQGEGIPLGDMYPIYPERYGFI